MQSPTTTKSPASTGSIPIWSSIRTIVPLYDLPSYGYHSTLLCNTLSPGCNYPSEQLPVGLPRSPLPHP